MRTNVTFDGAQDDGGSKSMMNRRTLGLGMVAGASALATGSIARALTRLRAQNIVLVHGLFADGSSWSEVIPRLQAAGLNVTSVQNPLTTLDEAVASARQERTLTVQRVLVSSPGTPLWVFALRFDRTLVERGLKHSGQAFVAKGPVSGARSMTAIGAKRSSHLLVALSLHCLRSVGAPMGSMLRRPR